MSTMVRQSSGKVEQAQLKQEYLDIIRAEVWQDQRMIDHCAGKVAYIVRLTNGDIVPIDKYSINKDFCFGYSDSRYNNDDFDRANNMVSHAMKSEKYFIDQNMKEVNGIIANLDGTERTNYRVYVANAYYGQPENSKLKHWGMFNPWDGESKTEISEADKQLIIEGYKVVRAEHEKKVRAYLKRYGTSKVNAWSYWRDE